MARSSAAGEDLGKLLLRLVLGVLILLHGIAKLISGPAFVVGLVTKMGLPQPFAYLVYVGEVLAPILLILGVWTRPAGLVVVINMVVAIWLAHTADFFTLSQTGGWALELQGMFLVTGLAIALLGAGRYSIGGAGGRWN